MPTFRVRTANGAERTVQAHRVIADMAVTTFEIRSNGEWHAVLEIPSDDVAVVHRRINEVDGRWAWITERPHSAMGVRRLA